MIAADLDIRRDELGVIDVRAAEHDVLRTALDVIINDLDITRAGPAADALRLLLGEAKSCDVAIFDRRGRAIEFNAASRNGAAARMNVGAVDLKVVRDAV